MFDFLYKNIIEIIEKVDFSKLPFNITINNYSYKPLITTCLMGDVDINTIKVEVNRSIKLSKINGDIGDGVDYKRLLSLLDNNFYTSLYLDLSNYVVDYSHRIINTLTIDRTEISNINVMYPHHILSDVNNINYIVGDIIEKIIVSCINSRREIALNTSSILGFLGKPLTVESDPYVIISFVMKIYKMLMVNIGYDDIHKMNIVIYHNPILEERFGDIFNTDIFIPYASDFMDEDEVMIVLESGMDINLDLISLYEFIDPTSLMSTMCIKNEIYDTARAITFRLI